MKNTACLNRLVSVYLFSMRTNSLQCMITNGASQLCLTSTNSGNKSATKTKSTDTRDNEWWQILVIYKEIYENSTTNKNMVRRRKKIIIQKNIMLLLHNWFRGNEFLQTIFFAEHFLIFCLTFLLKESLLTLVGNWVKSMQKI